MPIRRKRFHLKKSPGPFASKESGLGFLLCERAYPPYLSQNDSENHVFIRYVSEKIPCRLAEPVFFGQLRQPEIELLTFQVGMLYCDGDRVS